jgi:ParB-like chromosome segregation protein Spo0J
MKIANQEYKIVDINSIHPHERNVNQGDVGAIHESIEENDFFGALLVNKKTKKIIAGKHRWLAALQQGATEIPVIFIDDITEKKALKMMLTDNQLTRLGMDSQEALFELLTEMKMDESWGLKGSGFNEDSMDLMMSDLNISYEDISDSLKKHAAKNKKNNNILPSLNIEAIEEKKVDRAKLRVQEEDEDNESYIEVINQIQNLLKDEKEFTQSNEWGILDLDPDYQLEEVPENSCILWGTKKITTKPVYHFYTDDYRYTSLFKEPETLIQTKPIGIIEPNFGISNLFPKAVALYRIYQKRWIARNCQKHGIRVAVNLDIAPEFMDLNFLRVPKEWRSFAANGNILNIDLLYQYHQMAVNYTGNEDILYFVYGGGRRIGELSRDNNWIWIPDSQEGNKKGKK